MATFQIVLVIVAVIATGIILGLIVRKELQRDYCPLCSCRNCCNIGHGILSKVPEDTLIVGACQKR